MLGMGPGETPHGRPRCHGLLGARAGATCYPPAHAPGVRGSSSSAGRRGVDAGSPLPAPPGAPLPGLCSMGREG